MDALDKLLADAVQDHFSPAAPSEWEDPPLAALPGDFPDIFADFNHVEQLYADIHRSIDNVVSQIFQQHGLVLEDVRQQNQKIVTKLASLERDVRHRTPSIAAGSDRAASVLGKRSAEESEPANIFDDFSLSTASPSQPGVGARLTAAQLGSLSPVRLPEPYDMIEDFLSSTCSEPSFSSSGTPLGSQTASSCGTSPKRRKLCPKATNPEAIPSSETSSDSGLSTAVVVGRSLSKLAQKLVRIGDEESVARLDDFAERLDAAEPAGPWSPMPATFKFPTMKEIFRGSDFLRMLPSLAVAIESNMFNEHRSRLCKRIALAHFYHAYTLAQENPDTFLSWCEGKGGSKSLLPKGGLRSIVQHRFADLIFTQPPGKATRLPTIPKDTDVKGRVSKIQAWRKNGKHWATLIKRFGYGILLLVPPNLTDEDLRVAHDDEMAGILQMLDERMGKFAEPLQRANELLRTHVFANQDSVQIVDHPRPDAIDWDDFLQ